jgi:hypothetical protein
MKNVICCWLILLFGTAFSGPLKAESLPDPIRVAVVPFQSESAPGRDYLRCRVCGAILKSGPIEGDPTPLLTEMIWHLLQGRGKGYEFISPGQVEGVYNTLLAKGFERNTGLLMQSLGKQLKADYVLWGAVMHYQERQGTPFAAQRPAAATLDIHLLKVQDGTLVWKAHWSETQKSLTENLFEMEAFLKRKGRWVTVEELSHQGLEEMLKTFPPADSLR